MNFFLQILLWGFVAGIIHFLVLGVLYMNPVVEHIYKSTQGHSAVKRHKNQKEYILKMFLGTQVEVYIVTASFLYLRQFIDLDIWPTTIMLGLIFSGIRIYPRFWNMWIQTNYPNKLLVIEFVNGTIGTFIILTVLTYV